MVAAASRKWRSKRSAPILFRVMASPGFRVVAISSQCSPSLECLLSFKAIATSLKRLTFSSTF